MGTERTFVMIKPDGVERRLVGRIIQVFEDAGLSIVRMCLTKLSEDIAKQHYAIHKEKPFFKGLIKYVTRGPVVLMVIEGENAITKVRQLVGATDPLKAAPGSIRGRFALDIGENLVHASDRPETAEEEIKRFFPDI